MSTTTSAPAFWSDLARYGDRTALWTAAEAWTYDRLADDVERARQQLGDERRLVLLSAGRRPETVVWYLAALAGGHPVLMCSENQDHVAGLVERYDPDVVVGVDGHVEHRHAQPVHDLHPDLAVLLSTSGSTGSPKLVRLSHTNLATNAAAIAEYLQLRPNDRAITSLPLHYCYGLSVLHSHLQVGAAVVLTELSVVDPCFWETFRDAGVTGLSGVPHTFTLLDRVGFDALALPSLRYVTQAGGRLAPGSVQRYAELGHRNGWDFFVMYGQTEATARMAYLPPEAARDHPMAVGIPIPGGALRIDPVPECDAPGHGEIVYQGPNVMMGYAGSAADLALGPLVDELRTGDLGRRNADGLIEIVGRRSRFAKLFGLRIDLARLEDDLADRGIAALCASDDVHLYVATVADPGEVAERARQSSGLPPGAVVAFGVPELPRLESGKPDHAGVLELGRQQRAPGDAPGDTGEELRALYGRVLGIPDAARIDEQSSFVSLGGDSLSYVELSAALEDRLGHLPVGWHVTPIGELAACRRPRSTPWRRLDTSAVLRAVAIVLIVGNHADLWLIPGGAHVLLAVAGYNLARFRLGRGALWPSITRVAVPSMVWIGLVAAVSEGWGLTHALLVRSWIGPPDARWSYWFVETLLALLVGTALLFAVPWVRDLDRRRPLVVPLAVAAIGLAIRFEILDLPHQHLRLFRPQEVVWLFALGWAAARVSTLGQRFVLAAVGVGAAWSFFGNDVANTVLMAGVAGLFLLPSVPVPRLLVLPVTALASASLHIYLVHWQVLPHLDSPVLALVAGLSAGVVAWRVARRVEDLAAGRRGIDLPGAPVVVGLWNRGAGKPGRRTSEPSTPESPRHADPPHPIFQPATAARQRRGGA